MENDNFKFIEDLIKNNDVVLFMKGTADAPACGFSSVATMILKKLNIPFKDINVLSDDSLRQAIKDFTDWPTVPQLYIKGEFIGGCDIMREMYTNGDLAKIFCEK